MSKHTPGPWVAKNISSIRALPAFEVVAGKHAVVELVTTNYSSDHKIDSCEANARLIAAAPELLGALRCVVQNLETKRLNDGDRLALELARAAIAKAVTP